MTEEAFYIRMVQGTFRPFRVVNASGRAVCASWFATYSEAHDHCEACHGEVIGDWPPQ